MTASDWIELAMFLVMAGSAAGFLLDMISAKTTYVAWVLSFGAVFVYAVSLKH